MEKVGLVDPCMVEGCPNAVIGAHKCEFHYHIIQWEPSEKVIELLEGLTLFNVEVRLPKDLVEEIDHLSIEWDIFRYQAIERILRGAVMRIKCDRKVVENDSSQSS